MKASEFKSTCLEIIGPVYPSSKEWLEQNWSRVVDAVKLHSGKALLKALINCVNLKGKLDFFFKDLARYLPASDVGAGLVDSESSQEYFARAGLSGSKARPEKLEPPTAAEREEGKRLQQELKKKYPHRVGGRL